MVKKKIKNPYISKYKRRSKITIRKYPKNPDFYEVRGGGKSVVVMSKTRAKTIASARRRLRDKKRR